MYLRIFVEVPTKLTKDQKKKLQDSASFDLKQYDQSKKYSDNVNALYGTVAYPNLK